MKDEAPLAAAGMRAGRAKHMKMPVISALPVGQAALVTLLGFAYAWAVFLAIGYAAAVPLRDPLAWTPLELSTRVLLAGDLLHLLAVVAAAMPVSVGLRLFMAERALSGAMLAGCVPVVIAVVQLVGAFSSDLAMPSLTSLGLIIWSLVKVALAPAVLLLVFHRMAPAD